MDVFEDKLVDWMTSNRLFNDARRILLAVSGGVDSVAMAHLLTRLRAYGRLGCDFVIAHVNHSLRGAESDTDEVFVSNLAQRLGVEVVTLRVDVPKYAKSHKLSIETAARMLRLKSLVQLALDNRCEVIATGHHADDQAETLIHRFMRGTGFRGLSGINPISKVYGGIFVRPMLLFRRKAIVQYCREHHLEWRQDASNLNLTYTRNRIRHRLMPVLESESENLIERLGQLANVASQFLSLSQKEAEVIFAKGRLNPDKQEYAVDQGILTGLPPWILYEVARKILTEVGVGLRYYSQYHFDTIAEMVYQDSAKASFPGGVEVAVDKGKVRFVHPAGEKQSDVEQVILPIGKTVKFGTWEVASRLLNREEVDFKRFLNMKDSHAEWLDADKIDGSITIRSRQKGDRFYPIGGRGEKKIARFLIDAGLDRDIKQKVFIVADTKKILWLAPVRMSKLGQVTSQTVRILEIQVSQHKR